MRLRDHRQSPHLRSGGLAGLMMVLATIFESPKPFRFDAGAYWSSAVDLSSGIDPFGQEGFQLRGAWTAILYLPAAVVTRVFGASNAGFAVIVENSLMIAFIGVVLVPSLVSVWRPVTPITIYASAAVTWLLLGRFAPYPLTDVGAAALLLAAVVLLAHGTRRSLGAAGLLAGVGFNIRPAYLLTTVTIAVAVLCYQRRRTGIWFAGGSALALLPQVLTNLSHGDGWRPWPAGTGSLTMLQSAYASFVVRYDTLAYVPTNKPQLFFCDPRIARAVGDDAPRGPGELAAFYAHHPAGAVLLVVEKIGASLHWPESVPYYARAGLGDALFAFLVTAVTVAGAISLARQGWRDRPPTLPQVGVAAVWVGSLLTIATTAPETRFAVPLVIFGVVGCVAGLGRSGTPGVPRWSSLVAGTVAVAAVFAAGQLGLHHPAPQGHVTPAICARS